MQRLTEICAATSYRNEQGPLRRSKLLYPFRSQLFLQSLLETGWHRIRLSSFVKRYRLTDIVNDDLARIASGQMLLEFIADRVELLAIYVIVECFEKFFASHESLSIGGTLPF